jgi:hypothetical protein
LRQKNWRRFDTVAKLILGETFNDGIEVIAKPVDRHPATSRAYRHKKLTTALDELTIALLNPSRRFSKNCAREDRPAFGFLRFASSRFMLKLISDSGLVWS